MKFRLQEFRSASAFTMVEIALCLAIVGFALVAIIGVLPAGLNVQKENREDTILNQDSTVWFDAIRSGSFGYDELTNYVDRIVVSNYNFNASGNFMSATVIIGERPENYSGAPPEVSLDSGGRIVGLLSTPKFGPPTVGGAAYSSNFVYAYVRAISGTATEKPTQENPEIRAGAFAYRMIVEVLPAGSVDYANILTNASDLVARRNLHDVRLLCRWPLKKPFDPNQAEPLAGNSRMVFRSQVSGRLADEKFPYFFFQPADFR